LSIWLANQYLLVLVLKLPHYSSGQLVVSLILFALCCIICVYTSLFLCYWVWVWFVWPLLWTEALILYTFLCVNLNHCCEPYWHAEHMDPVTGDLKMLGSVYALSEGEVGVAGIQTVLLHLQ
jgi:hypothetical protein